MNLLVGPPGCGKTGKLLDHARRATEKGKRVWWVGLPSQRSYVYHRATEAGAILGLEFMGLQQVYYRLIGRVLQHRPLVVGTGRIALVGEALAKLRGELPAPGEARLFTQAVAEAKRFNLSYKDVTVQDEETRRFREVFRLYEALKGEGWDYDDYRNAAMALAEAGEARPEADLMIVDGFREMGPVDMRLYTALAKNPALSNEGCVEVWMSLPEPPPTYTASEQMAAQPSTRRHSYRAANTVSEARWVLRSLKRDLASGVDVLGLAVILPERQIKAFLALSDEYGVPLMDETPKALADTLAGRLLLDLLELPDYPTASKLLALPELAPLANAALERGVAGLTALGVLAEELGLAEIWTRWLTRLDLQGAGGELKWAESLLETTLPELRRELLDNPNFDWERFKAHALERAKEASALARGASFRAWWSALLNETQVFEPPRGGVALLTLKQAAGRRFKKAYLMHALEGAYDTGEGEDYFIPEEARRALSQVYQSLDFPKRFLGRNRLLFQELRTRADTLIVTYPEADQSGPKVPEPELVGESAEPLPKLPAGSRLELSEERRYEAQVGPLSLGRVSVQGLKRYGDCAFRYWAERRMPYGGASAWWRELVHDMRAFRQLSEPRLEELRFRYPQAAGWLAEVSHTLTSLRFGVPMPEDRDGPHAYLDAASRQGDTLSLYRFAEPSDLWDEAEAKSHLEGRWNELWATGYALEHYAQISRVRLYLWPVLGQPIDAYGGDIEYVWRRIATRQSKASALYERFSTGAVQPQPGYHCRECRVRDLCREGQT